VEPDEIIKNIDDELKRMIYENSGSDPKLMYTEIQIDESDDANTLFSFHMPGLNPPSLDGQLPAR
jgi:hypothetical protein